MAGRHHIAIAAHKGGAGKTTIAANLAGALAAAGHQVLVIDCDPQGALGAALGVEVTKPTLYEVLIDGEDLADAVHPTAVDRLAVVPADLDLAGAEVELPAQDDWQRVLRRRLTTSPDNVDVVLLDTAPGLGVLPYVAIVASTDVVVACPGDFLSLRALSTVLDTVERARATGGARLLGIVPTMINGRTRHEAEVLELLHREHGPLLLPEVRRRVVLQDAALAGLPVSAYAAQSPTAHMFTTLAEEVLHRAQ